MAGRAGKRKRPLAVSWLAWSAVPTLRVPLPIPPPKNRCAGKAGARKWNTSTWQAKTLMRDRSDALPPSDWWSASSAGFARAPNWGRLRRGPSRPPPIKRRRWALIIALQLLELQPGEGALARGVFGVLPQHPLAVLADVLGDERHGVLAVVVELDGPDDGVRVLGALEPGRDLGAIRPDGLDGVDDQGGRHVREGPVGLRRLLEAGLGVGLEESLAAGQLLG